MMRYMFCFRSKRITLVLLAAAVTGCGGDNSEPTPRVPTTLEATPASAILFSAAPGNTIQLEVVTKDQDGTPMDEVGPVGFSSSDETVATVGQDGTVAAVGTGTAQITASLSSDDATLSDVVTVTVEDAPATAAVTAPQFAYEPNVVDVSTGGSVTWTFGELPHTVTFITPGAPSGIDGLQDGSASRTFPASGVFEYRCEFHSGMAGTVRVH
jgi:plastocyanin